MLDPKTKASIVEATLEELNIRLLEAGSDSDFDFADVWFDLVAILVHNAAEQSGSHERSLNAMCEAVKLSLIERGLWTTRDDV